MPAYNAEATLEPCLRAINAAIRPGDEVIIYDDGATDSTNAIAVAAGVRILRNDEAPKGPAHGRNAAAAVASADLLLFVDADVVIAADVIDILAADIVGSGAIAAFGSYDDAPRSLRSTSLYANLRHHYVHQNGPVDASTFWSGIGMIDRKVFLRAGGYDAALFKFPSIEDVELGVRLISAGYRIRLVRSAQGKHCKDWSLWRVWHTDVVRRAIPWSGLIADGQTAGVDLNLAAREKVTTLFALAVPVLLVASVWNLWLLLAGFVAMGIYVYRNRGFFDVLRRRMGVPDFLMGIAMHWFYHIYASVAFVSVFVLTRLGLRQPPRYLSFKPS
ncbi:hypothetical protein BH09PSE3_BH09PSE3_00330 [soil metagenome]